MSAGSRGQLADFLRSRRARLTPADVGLPAGSEPGRRRTPGLRREEVAELSGVGVYDAHFDYLAWNEPYRRIRHDPAGLAAGRRNLLWMMFTDAENRARMTTWDRAARALLSQFRAAAGRHPDDPRFAELVAALTEASPQFRDWWAEYPVRYFRPARIRISHPQAGRITLEMFQLRLEDDPGMLMVMQVPADPDSRDRVTALLAGPPPRPPG